MPGQLKTLIEKGIAKAKDKKAEGGPDVIYWDALEDVLDGVHDQADDWQEVGEQGLKDLLSLVASDTPLAAKLAWIEQASPDELIEEMRRVGERLDAFSDRRDKLKSLLVGLLKTVGPIGAKLALGVLFPAASGALGAAMNVADSLGPPKP